MAKKFSFVNIIFFVVFGVLTGHISAQFHLFLEQFTSGHSLSSFRLSDTSLDRSQASLQAISEPSYGHSFPETSFRCILRLQTVSP